MIKRKKDPSREGPLENNSPESYHERMNSTMQIKMDRFAYGAPDMQDHPLDHITDCASTKCKQTIHFGEDAIEYDGDLYCSDRCFIWSIGGTKVKAGMGELA